MRVAAVLVLGLLLTATAAAAGQPSVKTLTQRAFAVADAVGDSPASCARSIGRTRALRLVRYCRYVSSATHPPCNSANTCELIVDHIRQTCPAPVDSALPCSLDLKPADWSRVRRLPAL